MTERQYCVVFSGQVAEGREVESVRRRMAEQFRLGEDEIATLFSGRPVVLKRGLARSQAVTLRNRLAQVGALGLIREQAAETGTGSAASAATTTAPATPPGPGADPAIPAPPPATPAEPAVAAEPAADESLECPRCAHVQPAVDACSHCGLDLRLHRQRVARRRQRLARSRAG